LIITKSIQVGISSNIWNPIVSGNNRSGKDYTMVVEDCKMGNSDRLVPPLGSVGGSAIYE